jgi:acyl-CoA dehydrogenase
VDRLARFPAEVVAALREERMLSSLVPVALGGEGATLGEVAEDVAQLGRHCASSAMIYAMHQIQVACIVRHGRSPYLQGFLKELVSDQLLLASATTEVGTGGDLRTSGCAIVPGESEHAFCLEKQAPVISYGQYADAILTTARRTPESPPSDQVLAVCRASELTLEPISSWDTLGFRGTCSLGFQLTASGDEHAILDDDFDDLASQTMLPVAHLLWSSVWQGIAAAALDRARRFVQAEARKHPGVTSPSALRLAELVVKYQQLVNSIQSTLREYSPMYEDAPTSPNLSFTIALNGLKISASRLVVDVVAGCLEVCGIAGYREDSPFSLGRHLRDAHGAALMVNNDRILANNAQLLLVQREF